VVRSLGILLVSLALGCAGARLETLPSLGDRFPLPKSAHYLMTASAQLWPYKTVRIEGIGYDIASDRKGHVAYIGTSDKAFKTPEGLSVESTLTQVLATGAEAPWPEPGWAYHTKLPSGWSAAFVVGPEMTGGPLRPDSKVAFFFQRD